MKTFKKFFLASFLFFSALILLTSPGCSKDDTTSPPQITPITEDLFPLTPGRQITYSGFLRAIGSDTNITAFAAYQSKWTIINNSTPTPVGGTANLVLDSTFVPSGVASPPAVWVTNSLLIQRSPSTGSSNFAFMQNIAPFYRAFGITATDTLRFINLAQLDKGENNTFTAFDSTWTTGTGDVRLQIVGTFEGRESLSLAGETFNTYRLVTKRQIYLGGSTNPNVIATTATLWLAPGIGPVKMILNADSENYGHFREYTGKNF